VTDADIALALSAPFRPDADEVVYFAMKGNPASKARPRFDTVRRRTYEPASNRKAEEATRWYFRAAFAEPRSDSLMLAAVFYRADLHRIDADNMLKHLCDAGTGVAWVDDSQITAIVGVVELDRQKPRTLVVVAPHMSTMNRGPEPARDCEHCGKTYKPGRRYNGPPQRFCCSQCAIWNRGVDLSQLVACSNCGVPFKRRTAATRLCSEQCRVEELVGVNRSRASDRPYSTCVTCGAQLAHRRGGRCRTCWRAAPTEPAPAS
jgi:Holliday junction resolvase RusA-like endonuclease